MTDRRSWRAFHSTGTAGVRHARVSFISRGEASENPLLRFFGTEIGG